MSYFYRRVVRPVLFEQESETAHERMIQALSWMSQRPLFRDALASFFEPPPLPVRLFGLAFPNPVGLAAGMDKYAAALPAWEALGFGFTELGGVTWNPQPGNPRPRLFRVVSESALINRMGFNNPGAEVFAQKLQAWKNSGLWPKHPVAINLGKSKDVPLDKAPEDYAHSLEVLWPFGDFFVVNVSSPNTPGLRQLQGRGALEEILGALKAVNARNAARHPARPADHAPLSDATTPAPPLLKPILVKVDPDLALESLDDLLETALEHRVSGIVATNTTVSRPEAADPAARKCYAEPGGLSGRPLRPRSTEVIRHIHQRTRGQLPIIGVGGIFSAQDAWEKMDAGASLVQLYTGLVYEGPGIVHHIIAGLRARAGGAGLPAGRVGFSQG